MLRLYFSLQIRLPLKTTIVHIIKSGIFLVLFLFLKSTSFSQGRIVVNEFMAWSGCNTTSEYIELMNFGPGPMNIGCYIVTNGQYAVTIPPNTILQPGEYFVLAGRDTLAKDCGNRDSAIKVDLNWTTCNCANTTIPVTGDGFMADGGSANEKVVLLDPNLNIIDAVSRQAPPSASISITTSTVAGNCTSKSFDLDTMGVNYETIGESTGIDNSYSRKVDGDCGWVKTTQISASAPNKTNNTSSVTYSFNAISTSNCNDTTGSIAITVNSSSGTVSSFFPMNFIVARDIDSNLTYNSSDAYTYGVDSVSPNIDINNLYYGRYRITVASSLGCNLKSFDFFVFNCYTVLLPLKIISFNYRDVREGGHIFEGKLSGIDNLKKIVLEGSNGDLYAAVTTISSVNDNGSFTIIAPLPSFKYYRLRLVDKKDAVTYSQIISVNNQNGFSINRLWPNPTSNKLTVDLYSEITEQVWADVHNLTSLAVKKEKIFLKKGVNSFSLSLSDLPAGVYQLSIPQGSLRQPIAFRFVKQ